MKRVYRNNGHVPNETGIIDVGGKQVLYSDIPLQHPLSDPPMPLINPRLCQI